MQKQANNRVTSSCIEELQPGEIFVFGSNLEGQHGGGAALLAYSFGTTVCAIAALMLVSSALLVELYRRKKLPKLGFETVDVEDISSKDFVFISLTAIVLLLSLVNPLWFIRG